MLSKLFRIESHCIWLQVWFIVEFTIDNNPQHLLGKCIEVFMHFHTVDMYVQVKKFILMSTEIVDSCEYFLTSPLTYNNRSVFCTSLNSTSLIYGIGGNSNSKSTDIIIALPQYFLWCVNPCNLINNICISFHLPLSIKEYMYILSMITS